MQKISSESKNREDENWIVVPGYPNYEASDLGIVRVKKNKKILDLMLSKSGYYRICLSKQGKKKKFKRSIIIAMCFLNHKADGTHKIVVDHKDKNRINDRLDNLRLMSHRENISTSKENKTSKYTGVCWDKARKKWRSQINIKGKLYYLGHFIKEKDAYKAYQNKLKTL